MEVAKSWPCSMGVDSLVNLLFPLSSDPCPAWFSSRAGFYRISTSSIAAVSSEVVCFLFPSIPPEIFFSFLFRAHSLFPTKRSFIDFLGYVDMKFLELSLSLGILELSRLILIYRFLTLTHWIRLLSFFLFDNRY